MSGITSTIAHTDSIPTSITNDYSAGGRATSYAIPQSALSSSENTVKGILSGALTANVFSTILSITGKGFISFLGVGTRDATARQISLRVTLDGVVIFNAQSSSISGAGRGMIAIGTMYSGTNYTPEYFTFNNSLLVEVASTLSETDLVAISTIYGLRS